MGREMSYAPVLVRVSPCSIALKTLKNAAGQDLSVMSLQPRSPLPLPYRLGLLVNFFFRQQKCDGWTDATPPSVLCRVLNRGRLRRAAHLLHDAWAYLTETSVSPDRGSDIFLWPCSEERFVETQDTDI